MLAPETVIDAEPPRRAWRPEMAVWLAVVVGGLALRLWVIRSDLGVIDSDEAVGGLIARHFAHGDPAIFLWGNNYGGTAEAILGAPLLALVGASALAWKSVMVAMYAAACLLTWRIGLRTVGPVAARGAAALLWLASGGLVLMSTKGRLYYGTALVLTTAAVLLCLRLNERVSRRDVAGLGLVVGLGVWTAPFCFYVFVPIIGWLVLRRPRRLRELPYAIPGVLVGAAPWLVFNLRHDWSSLSERPVTIPTSYAGRLWDFFTQLGPRLLGFRWYWGDWAFPGAKWVYVALLAVGGGLVAYCLVRRHSPLVPLVSILAAYPFLFAAPAASWYQSEPRYGIFVAPVIALLLARGVVSLLRRPAAQLAALGTAGLLSVATLTGIMNFTDDHPGLHDISPPRLEPLAAALYEEGIGAVTAEYWIAYALAFETDERIVATETELRRFAPYRDRFEEEGATTYVYFSGSASAQDFEKKATTQQIRFQQTVVDRFSIYRLERPLRPADPQIPS